LSTLIAVDPGDVHVGVAYFDRDPGSKYGWRCTHTAEYLPDEFSDGLAEEFVDQDPEWEFLVYEKFRLYEDKAAEQKGSEFPTAKLIGVIEWLGRKHNEHAGQHRLAEERGLLTTCEGPGGTCNAGRPGGARNPHHVELVKQPAEFWQRSRRICNALGIKSVAVKEGDALGHRKVAELHGWYYILRHIEKVGIAENVAADDDA
jgi:hypothetical protein